MSRSTCNPLYPATNWQQFCCRYASKMLTATSNMLLVAVNMLMLNCNCNCTVTVIERLSRVYTRGTLAQHVACCHKQHGDGNKIVASLLPVCCWIQRDRPTCCRDTGNMLPSTCCLWQQATCCTSVALV